ncbi:MAG: hypothetical protein CMJ58_16825 [Planctomycetaceae bacterium]|nr:hypothetical protein [Planctomycetaceae bacterium]
MPEVFSTADVARLLSVKPWQVRRLFEDGTLPEPPRIGNQRAISRELIAHIASAMQERGWLPKTEVAAS